MLPAGWCQVPLREMVEADAPIIYGILQPGPNVAEGVPYVRPTEIVEGEIDLSQVRRTSSEIADRYRRSKLKPGDLLLSIVGTIGKVAIVPEQLAGGNITQSSCRVRPSVHIDRLYTRYFLKSPMATSQYDEMRLGTAVPRLNLADVRELMVPLAPAQEQRRIVAKLDALSARSKCARTELDRIRQLVSKTKQAILEAAFRGTLTADWRDEQATTEDESEAELLARLDATRRRTWSRLARGNGRRNYSAAKPPMWFPDLALPNGWHWVSVDQVTALSQYGTSKKTEALSSGVPVLRMGNLKEGRIDWSNLKYLPESHPEFPDLLLGPGDVLFNRTNSAELVGKTAVFTDPGRPASFASYLIRLRLVAYLPWLLSAYINSPIGRTWIRDVVSQQVGQANVNGTKLGELAVPYMPEREQAEIARRIEASFDALDRLFAEARSAETLLDRLNQAILAQAFRGELVQQDANDEPASVLLERIRASRANNAKFDKRPQKGPIT